MKTGKDLFGVYHTENKPRSRRALLIQDLSDLIGVPFKNVFNECWHLKEDWGNDILQGIYEDVKRTGDNTTYRALKLRELINKSRGK